MIRLSAIVLYCIYPFLLALLTAWAFQKRSRPQQLTLCRGLHAEALQATASEGLAQCLYVAARAGFEPTTLLRRLWEGASRARAPNNWESPMHLLLITTFCPPNILVCPPNIFNKSMPAPSSRKASKPMCHHAPYIQSKLSMSVRNFADHRNEKQKRMHRRKWKCMNFNTETWKYQGPTICGPLKTGWGAMTMSRWESNIKNWVVFNSVSNNKAPPENVPN